MTLFGLFLPFFGTSLGAATVFLMKSKTNPKLEKLLMGFASGVMIAASVWSLLIPSIELSGDGALRFLPASAGFSAGVCFFLVLDYALPKIKSRSVYPDRIRSTKKSKTAIMIIAVTLHNIPEGMAVGVSLAAARGENAYITAASAMALCVGIAIQNFPEGAIISMPLKAEGKSKAKAFFGGVLSGAVEPIAGALTLILTKAVSAALPYLLAFAAGAMIYVVAEELIPDSKAHGRSCAATLGLMLGFVVMMTLDVVFG